MPINSIGDFVSADAGVGTISSRITTFLVHADSAYVLSNTIRVQKVFFHRDSLQAKHHFKVKWLGIHTYKYFHNFKNVQIHYFSMLKE